MTITIVNITFTAIVDGKKIERTFIPEQKGLPGIMRDVFSSIRFYLVHNPYPYIPCEEQPQRAKNQQGEK